MPSYFPFRLALWASAGASSALAAWMTLCEPHVPSEIRMTLYFALPIICVVFFAIELRLTHVTRQRQREECDRTLQAGRDAAAQTAAIRAKLEDCELRCQALLESQTDVVLTRAGDSSLTFANNAFFACFGLTPQTAMGKPFAPELHPQSRRNVSDRFANMDTDGGRIQCEQRIKTAQGWRWFYWQDRFVRSQDGRIVEIQSIGRDIEDRKAVEAELQAQTARAEAENKAKTAFLMAMSREIRASVNGMNGLAKLLLSTPLNPEQQSYTNAFVQSGEILANLTNDILDSSKIEAGNLVLVDERTALHRQLEDIAELFGPRAHAKGIELTAVIAPDVPTAIYADGRRIRQVLTNLIGLSIKNTRTGGVRVDICRETAGEGPRLRFLVADTSGNLSDDWREGVMRAFSGHEDTQSYEGTLLGLAVSQHLIKAMGGEIGFEEAEGGSRFWFVLPETVAAPAPPQTAALADINVAVIVANPILRQALTTQIHYAGGVPASLTLEGLRSADIILVDTGTDAEPKPLIGPVPVIPTIVLLPPVARPNLSYLRAQGYAGYLVKPVRLASLVERVRVCDGMANRMRSAKALMAGQKTV